MEKNSRSRSQHQYRTAEEAQVLHNWSSADSTRIYGNDPAMVSWNRFAGVLNSAGVGDQAWFEVTREERSILVDVINPLSMRLGRNALLDTIELAPGDSVTLGRQHYPELSPYASREHALITNVWTPHLQVVGIEDLSSNGTRLYKTPLASSWRQDEDDEWQTRPGFTSAEEEMPPSYPPKGGVGSDELFADARHEAFPALSVADFAMAQAAIASLSRDFSQPDQRRMLERALNREFHPDMKVHPDPAVSHQLYLLIKQELGF